jgi:dimethylargininase
MEPIIRVAIVRPPGPTFAQHAAYAAALEDAGVRLVRLPPDPAHPDSTFVEDTAVIVGDEGILTRPGAPSRRGEVLAVRPALQPLVAAMDGIEAPGTLDGGDVLEAGERFLIGVSAQTNEAGARGLSEWLQARGRAADLVDIRGIPGVLHLKTGISWLGAGIAAAVPALAPAARSIGLDPILVDEAEAYGANSILVNGRVLLPAGCPRLEGRLRALGLRVVALEMSEFEKMDGGMSCLSLRLPGGGRSPGPESR